MNPSPIGTRASRARCQKPLFQWVTRERVPSGVITSRKSSWASSAARICPTNPVLSRRFTGMPPQRRNVPASGVANSESLPTQRKLMPTIHFAHRPIGKSQFDVCG